MDLLEDIRRKLRPDFEASDGKAFYGKLAKGDLAFFHYIQGPVKDNKIGQLAIFGDNLAEYESIILYSNGLIMYDKTLSLYGVGESINRSLSFDSQIAYRMEDENCIFEILSEQSRKSRVRKVGALDLSSRYNIIIDPSGECLLKNDTGRTLSFGGLDRAMFHIIRTLEDLTVFSCELTDTIKVEIEDVLISIGGGLSAEGSLARQKGSTVRR